VVLPRSGWRIAPSARWRRGCRCSA
jgi:hypothetical protein